ncbi:MAG TPA: GNAT family N-acetyltransferase, partial [Chitinophagales bacterium]|nr:GNAT family N-acetyltransferase [Chitinophagales bacterium]
LEVSRFYVDQAHQGAGYGRMLMNQAEVNARMLNKQVIWLSVWKRNPRSVNIYTSLGYTIVGETIFQLGSDAQEDYIMIKRL